MLSRSDVYYCQFSREDSKTIARPAPRCHDADHYTPCLWCKPTCNLLQLPNELLEHIALALRPTTRMYALEGTGLLFHAQDTRKAKLDAVPEMKSYRYGLYSLSRFAQTCSSLKPIVERVLYRDIQLPLLPGWIAIRYRPYPHSLSILLARTLFARPDLAAYVTSLELWLLDRRLVASASQTLLPSDGPYFDVFSQALTKVSGLQIDWAAKGSWMSELSRSGEMALQATIIGSLPNLKCLLLSGHTVSWDWNALDSRIQNSFIKIDRPYMDIALRYNACVELTVGCYLPLQALPMANLTILRLEINFFVDRVEWLDSPVVIVNVRELSIIANNVGPFADQTTIRHRTQSISYGIRLFLRDSVPGVKRFKIETPVGTIPTIPSLNDAGVASSVTRLDNLQDVEKHGLYNSRTDPDTWFWLTLAIIPLKTRLTHLALPLNWYSSTGQHTGSFSGLVGFTKLESLEVPKIALLLTRRPGESENVSDVAAVNALPKTLQDLTVSQIDFAACDWVQEMLEHSKEQFPDLRKICLIFKDDQSPKFSRDFRKVVRKVGVAVTAQWKGKERKLA